MSLSASTPLTSASTASPPSSKLTVTFVGALDHVGVGDDRAVLVDHEARARGRALLAAAEAGCPALTPWAWMNTTPRPSSR